MLRGAGIGLIVAVAALTVAGCGNLFASATARIDRCTDVQRNLYPHKYTEQQLQKACLRFEQQGRLKDDGSLKGS